MSRELSPRAWQVLVWLGDGAFHSGNELAQCLQVSRATVFNVLGEIEAAGVAVQRVLRRGYRLSQPWRGLDAELTRQALADSAARFAIEVLPQAASSNLVLLQRAAQGAPSATVLAVELQTAGRGRLGRTWHSGLGNALTFSLLWRFDCGLNALSGLSLAVGLAIVHALQRLGAQGVTLKWPNDVLTPYGKLGGVLIEAQGDMLGPCAVVIGIGLNVSLPLHLEQRIDQAASALDQVCADLPAREQILAAVLDELAQRLEQFSREGFAPMRAAWQQHHARQDASLNLQLPDGSVVSGIARGVTERGELQLETAQGWRSFNSGEVAHEAAD